MPLKIDRKVNVSILPDSIDDVRSTPPIETGDASADSAGKQTSGGASGRKPGIRGDLLAPSGFKIPSSVVTKSTPEGDVNRKIPDMTAPVVIAGLQFLPDTSDVHVEKFIDLQVAARSLAVDDVEHVIGELRDDDSTADTISELEKNRSDDVTAEIDRAKTLGQLLQRMDDVKNALDIHQVDSKMPEIVSKIREGRDKGAIQGSYRSFRQLLSCQMRFGDKSFESFSNTRIIMQVLSDLAKTIDLHSPHLMSPYSDDRTHDVDPVYVDTDFVRQTDFSFSGNMISSAGRVRFDPTNYADFRKFVGSLPPDEVQRFKLLCAFISKELRISTGFFVTGKTPPIAGFTGAQGASADLIGKLPTSIVDKPTQAGIMRIVSFVDDRDNKILPLERRIVRDSSDSSFLPGTYYLVDGILDSDARPDMTPVRDYTSTAADEISKFNEEISSLLNLDDQTGKLTCFALASAIMNSMSTVMDGLSDRVSKSAAVISAIIYLSQNDDVLRFLLYRLVLEIVTGTSTSGSVKNAADDKSGNEERGSKGKPNATQTISPNLAAKLVTRSGNATPTPSSGAMSVDFGSTRVESNNLPKTIEQRVNALLTGRGTLGTHAPQSRDIVAIQMSEGDISSILEGLVSSQAAFFQTVSEIVDIVNQSSRDIAGSEDGNPAFTQSGMTRCNSLTTDTVTLVIFEIVMSAVAEFCHARFSKTASHMSVVVNIAQNSAIKGKMRSLVGKTDVIPSTKFPIMEGLLDSVIEGMINEDDFVRDSLDLITAFFNNVTTTVKEVESLFNNRSSVGISKKIIAAVKDETWAKSIMSLTPSQNALSFHSIDVLTKTSDNSFMSDNFMFSTSERNAISAMLREPRFGNRSSDARLLAVGLPAGTLEMLRNPIFKVGSDANIASSRSDVVMLKIYRKDPQMSEIIFKPMTYLFDLSRFIDEDVVIDEGANFQDLIDTKFKLIEKSGFTGPGVSDSLSGFVSNNEYSKIRPEDRITMFRNHVEDYCLKLYMRLMTSMEIDDYTFDVSGAKVDLPMSKKTLDLLKKLYEDANKATSAATIFGGSPTTLDKLSKGKPVKSVISSRSSRTGNQAPVTKDAVSAGSTRLGRSIGGKTGFESQRFDSSSRTNIFKERLAEEYFKKILCSTLFSMDDIVSQVRTPKVFDRVLTVLVDPDDFVIDRDAMLKTLAGQETLKRMSSFGDVDLTQDDFTFSEYFVVAELGENR